MATLRKRCGKWRVQIKRQGVPYHSRTFVLRSDAEAWARQHEVDANRRNLPPDPLARFPPRAKRGGLYRETKRSCRVPEASEPWSLTGLREKLIKIGAKVVSHGRYVTFQVAEVAVPRQLFGEILRLIDGLRPRPVPS